MSGFESNYQRGFRLTFKNEWTVSVVWGAGSYSSNHDADFTDHRDKPWTADTAEVAAWDGNGKWLDEPLGWQTPNQVADFIAEISRKRKARKAAA